MNSSSLSSIRFPAVFELGLDCIWRSSLFVINLASFNGKVLCVPLKMTDRWLWVALSRLWSGWRSSLIIVKPGTVVAWHRKGFRLYWTWKSRQRIGRPKINSEVREIIQKMSRANPLWGAPRIHGELLKLGVAVAQATVAKYMVRSPRPPSQSWRTFLDNHISQLVSVDFFTVPRFGWRFYSCLSFWHMTVVVSSTSTLRIIPRLPGQYSKFWKPSRSRPSQSISFEIVMPFTDTSSSNKSKPWALGKYWSSTITLATCVCRTNHRLHSPRLSRPRDRLRPIITPPNSSSLLRLLSRIENSPIAR